MAEKFRHWSRKTLAFLRANGGNVAMMFGLSLVPITVAAGAGLDLSRAMMVKASMADALDAAALAVGSQTGKPSSCAAGATDSSCVAMKQVAQNYFTANYKADSSFGVPGNVSMVISNSSVTLSVTDNLPTTLLSAAGITIVPVTSTNTVVWGQTKLWVSLVLDNTGSMTQTDTTGTSKISALKTAASSLLTTLQGVSTTAGDVQVSIAPFAKLVNVGTSNVGASWIDWTDWEAEPVASTGSSDVPGFSVGPGSSCPWSKSGDGFVCVSQPGGSTTASTVPSSGTYKGYICPGVMQTYNASTGSGGHYFNGCYTSTAATQTNSNTICSGHGSCSCSGYSNCTCTGSGTSKVCTQTTTTNGYTHTWVHNAHSTWNGCIEDRAQTYDAQNTAPSGASLFPAANDDNCPATAVMGLSYNWTSLSSEITSMSAQGSTNQTIGLAHGWQTLTPGTPYGAPALPANTSQFIILVSDGLNTQDRWYGDGSNQSTSVDNRMASACTNAKAAGITIYTIFVDLGGTQGNSTVLQNCATDSSKYFDLTTSGAIITTFATIAQKIASLHVSQ